MSLIGKGVFIGSSASPAPPAPIEEKYVNLYDYDGTLLYSYDRSEALALQDLPATAGTYETLTFDAWNWTLQQIKSYLTDYPDGKVIVGAMYNQTHTDNRIHITIAGSGMTTLPINFSVSSGTVTIDWGDGTIESSSGNASHTYSPLTYSANYIIKMSYSGSGSSVTFNQNCFGSDNNTKSLVTRLELSFGNVDSRAFERCPSLISAILPQNSSTYLSSYSFNASTRLRTVLLPKISSVNSNVFENCYGLTFVSCPTQVNYFGSSAFAQCHALKSIALPPNQITFISSAFSGCSAVSSLTLAQRPNLNSSVFANCLNLNVRVIPTSTNDIPTRCFYENALTYIKIPSSVTSIGNQAFMYCESLALIDLSEFDSTTIPALSNANAFTGIPSNARFAVKNQTMLNTFMSATNWSTYATQFIIKDW